MFEEERYTAERSSLGSLAGSPAAVGLVEWSGLAWTSIYVEKSVEQ